MAGLEKTLEKPLLVYGVYTNSLGLISDAIHMAFDNLAIAIGLFASIMATWKPDSDFTYGYGRVETLSGFANGVLLILSIERIINPPEMEVSQLMVVSLGGLFVNLFGMFAMGGVFIMLMSAIAVHSYTNDESKPLKASAIMSHSHATEEPKSQDYGGLFGSAGSHGHDDEHAHHHEHSHTHTDHHKEHSHDHSHNSHHSHNMRGVFLHILADTMGSVGVVISTLMIQYWGWTGFDPIASLFIAVLIIASVVPLVIDCRPAGSSKNSDMEVKPKKTRNRQALSCTECKRRKIKCDRQQPCGACTKRHEEHKCVWEEKKVIKPRTNHPYSDQVAYLQEQLAETQSCLRGLASFLRSSGIPVPNNMFDNMSRLSPPSSAFRMNDLDLEDEETAAAFTLEGIAMGRRPDDNFNDEAALLRRKRTDSVNSLSRRTVKDTPAPFSGGNSAPLYCDPPSVTTSLDQNAGFPFTPKPQESMFMTKGILQYLPNKAKADVLITFYLQHLEWLHKPLHVPTFISEYNQYWQDMSIGFATDNIDPKWMSLYASVLCVSTHFGGEYYYNNDRVFGNPEVEARNEKEADIYYQISRSALSQSDFLINHSLEAIQTIIILGLYLHNKNQTETHLILMSTAIKMAQLMGLSRIPDESAGSETQGNVVEREMSRRLWHSLVFQDSFNASASSYSYAIHVDQMTTSVPANVDDDELIANTAIPFVPDSVWTDMSYFRSKLHFANITRKIVDTLNRDSKGSYEFVIEMDTEYRAALDRIPSFLRLDLTDYDPKVLLMKPCRAWERLMMSFTIHNRLMRLHRGYMIEGYSKPEYSVSTQACVASAKTLLALMKEGRKYNWPASRWWVVLIQCWTASIVILIDLFYTSDVHEAEAKSKEVREALVIFRDIQHVSTVAKKAVLTLDRLLEEDKERRADSTASKKRKISIEGFTPIGLAPNYPGLHGDNTNTTRQQQSMLNTILPVPQSSSNVDNSGDVWENMFKQELGLFQDSSLDFCWKFDEYA
ncbi:hypothetical protein E3Q23_01853 [Wallemia mellicola]|uniref:Zn(2)-C6 fungal-type domain-containing protein n=1 Tax=Wallemia mellicola TaxID=1708541 RepID=A0A4T0SUX5_9BASI|nr:hypothetical protein E3Q23_01853 [Wallemia mellicola]TIC56195.1 hypothetical protein E3Q05_01893 [Wallemia mellicola]TIC65919.1 hypothetical protein E3Q01_01914 [Wallemia mellicola]